MPTLTIDNIEIEVPADATILDAARKLDIEIPTLCFLQGCEPCSSCFVCVVKIAGQDNFAPACATVARDGMEVQTRTPEVLDARRTALELLLSDHVGDCIAPCQTICPAGLDIPGMIRQIAAGQLREAIATVKRDIPLPAVLGRICPAPCEKGCRRRDKDSPVAICLLKRYVADLDLAGGQPHLPNRHRKSGKKIAVVGAGPAGLSAAYYLLSRGHECTLFDEHDQPGGMLRYGVEPGRLPADVLDAEIAVISRLGAQFRLGAKIAADQPPALKDLRKDFDAVVLGVGRIEPAAASALGVASSDKGIEIDTRTGETSLPGVFAGGDAVRRRRLAVCATADGKSVAESIDQYLTGCPVTGPGKAFSTHVGRLHEGEIEIFAAGAGESSRGVPATPTGGFTADQAQAESLRCLHCDCRKADNCKLRNYAAACGARTGRFKGRRRDFEQYALHADVIYEPGKCISCGLCVQITDRAAERFGMTFLGRGFDVRVNVPFSQSLADGLERTAAECVAACPTGALAFKS